MILFAVLGMSVVVAVSGLIGSLFIKSPSQRAADAAPPDRTVLTASVASRVVTNSIVLRGTVSAKSIYAISLGGSNLAQSGGGDLIVTRKSEAVGTRVHLGQLLAEVSGRPLILGQGRVPAYRDLTPGTHGDDVAQLQRTLGALGLRTGPDRPGYFGAATKRSVRSLYRRLGYDVPQAGAADELGAAGDDVRKAQRGLQALLATPARTPLEKAAVADAKDTFTAAQRRLTVLERRTGPMIPRSEMTFIPSFPAFVVSSQARLGATAQSPLMKLATGNPIIRAQLDSGSVPLVREGMKVNIDAEVSNLRMPGLVTALGAITSATSEAGTGPYAPVTVATDRVLPADLIGQDVRVTILAATTGGPVLTVPEAAINSAADGDIYVIKLETSGNEVKVPVTVGVSGDGQVQITPMGAALLAGEDVVTGQ